MNENEVQSRLEKKQGKGVKIALVTAACVVGVAAVGFGAACVAAGGGSTVHRGVSALGTDFGGMTRTQAEETLRSAVAQEESGVSFVSEGSDPVHMRYEDLGFTLDYEKTAEKLCESGRSGNALGNGWQYLAGIFGKKTQVEPEWTVDEAKLASAAEELAQTLSCEPIDFAYALDESGLRMTKPRDGRSISAAALAAECEEAVTSGDTPETEIAPEFETIPAEQGDLAAVQQELAEPCTNAYYDKETKSILPGRMHADFTLADAQSKLDAAEGGEDVLITTEVERPAVSTEALKKVLFRDKLSSYTTKVGGAPGRHSNVRVTANKINGVILNSGESMKYGELVMPFSLDNGYYMAPMYVQGKTVDGVGGGACQASSTLYAASLYANLEIVQRRNHGYASDYIGLGLDATVASGGPEFEVRNNTDYPIRIDAIFETKGGKDYITVNIIGTKVDDTYVKIKTDVLSTTPFQEEIIETDELAPGQRVVEQTAYTGYLVKTYRQIYRGDGTLISSNLEATSKYNVRNRIVKVGKAAPAATPTVDPTPTAPTVDPTPAAPVDPTPAAPVEPETPIETPATDNPVPPEATEETV